MQPKIPRASRRRTATMATFTVLATAWALSATGSVSAAPSANGPTRTYIVQLTGEPIATYAGDVAGLSATKPAQGRRVDTRSTQARKYADHLSAKRNAAMSRVPGAKKVYDYQTTFNGFAAKLTDAQATALRNAPGVLAVVADEVRTIDTIQTPEFLGMAGPGGVWQRQFGNPARAGEGMIVGMLDSGIWPEAPSFAPLPEPRPDAAAIAAKWRGTCDPGVEAPLVTCNNKLIGARYYNAGGVPADPAEFISPRDWHGHGSHTSGTAAGNHNVPVQAGDLNLGPASGMAPAARLAMYKVCWATDTAGGNGCATVDSVAATDQAVADGVDVINFSIGGSRTSVLDPVEVAFRNAAAAGVFVSTSAGNSGDTVGVSSVAHNSPWVTTVAASTHDRGFAKTVTLGNGASYPGIGMSAAVPSSPLIASVNAGLAGANAEEVRLCFSGTLDPAKVAGKIVQCDRGVNARVDKSKAVQMAGGVGMILTNVTPGSLNADIHFVPTIHTDHVNGAPIRAYAQTAGATAAISATDPSPVRAPNVTSFSSFGPALAGGGDLLKPDITAPGVDVLAAAAPPGVVGNGIVWGQISGTSMAAPHIAGIAALIMQKHPNWSVTAVKSALMTTASQTDNTGAAIQRGTNVATPLDYGSGHVVPGSAFDPGLVYESNERDWLRYSCGIGQNPRDASGRDLCPIVGKIDPSNLNYPSIAIGDIGGDQTVVRRVKNVSSSTSTYRATLEAPAGYRATVTPSRLTLRPGQSAQFVVKFTRTTATNGTWSFGSLTWADNRGHKVRSPIALRGVALTAPDELVDRGRFGIEFTAHNPGYTGTLATSVTGLVPGTVTALSVSNPREDFDPAAPAADDNTARAVINIPAGVSLARIGTVDFDYPTATDLDVYVYQQTPEGLVLVGGSNNGGTADDNGTLDTPEAGTYEVYVDFTFSRAGQSASTNVKLYSWMVTGAAGNATAAPASQRVTAGRTAHTALAWYGLASGQRYLGVVTYSDGTNVIGRTIARIDT